MAIRACVYGLAAVGLSWLTSGCGGDDESDSGQGGLVLTVSGEDAAKDGFPVEDDGEVIAFADDWRLSFDKYIVSLGSLSLLSEDGDRGYETSTTYVADLTLGDPDIVEIDGLAARRWSNLSFRVVAAKADAVRLNDVSDADLERMVQGGLTYWIEGTATKGDDSYRLQLALANPTTNARCTNGLDSTDGVVVKNNSTTEAELTVHIEHLFWDTLGAEQTVLRFDPFAAAADSTGLITLEGLSNQRLSDLRGPGGGPLLDGDGAPIIYDPASTPLPDQSLAEFVLAATSTQIHLNGIGLCTVTRL